MSLCQTSEMSHLFTPNARNGSPGSFSNPNAARAFPCERDLPAFSVGVTTNSSPPFTTSAANPPSIVRRKNVLPASRSAAAGVIWYVRSSNTATPSPHVATSASATGDSTAPPATAISGSVVSAQINILKFGFFIVFLSKGILGSCAMAQVYHNSAACAACK